MKFIIVAFILSLKFLFGCYKKKMIISYVRMNHIRFQPIPVEPNKFLHLNYTIKEGKNAIKNRPKKKKKQTSFYRCFLLKLYHSK